MQPRRMKGKLVPFQSAVVGDTGHMGLLGPALKCHLSHGCAVKQDRQTDILPLGESYVSL